MFFPHPHNNPPNFVLLVRGKPCAGKTSIVGSLKNISFEKIDPDLVNKNSQEYKTFKPRKTKNPNEMVKMYCYLFNKADNFLRENKNVIWMQPWSRIAEIELTIKNLAYYNTELKDNVWNTNTNEIIRILPFKFAVCEVDITNELSLERYLIKNTDSKTEEIERLKKTNTFFQRYCLDSAYLKLEGTQEINLLIEKLQTFIGTLAHPHINPHG